MKPRVGKKARRAKAEKHGKDRAKARRPAAERHAEPTPERRQRAKRVLAGLKRQHPEADCALRHRNALELLVATILSAQSTDATVNKVTLGLFHRYRSARAFAEANTAELEDEIHATGFFRQKAKSVQGACRRLVEAYGGEVPAGMDDLVTLPGVARKTANVVLGTWFKKNEGVVVDTHVGRLAHRMGLSWSSRGEKDAVRVEDDLMALIPRKDWTFFGHAMIWHGRKVCTARKPDCAGCSLARHCPSASAFG